MKKIVVASFFSIFFISPAYAYIDPGSGSAILSAIVGFFVAVGIVVKTYWYKLKSIFGLSSGKTNSSDINKE